MGRLTLNVLLSFAQFEREVTSERIRDKIAASKRKGLWVGGMAPLGYDTKDRKISINDTEADRVRTIFRSYLRLGSLNRVMAELSDRGIVTKVRTLKSGKPSAASHSRADRSPTCSATGSTLERWHSRVRSCRASNRPLWIGSSSMPSKLS
jgi:DNA invertase Pin-like site-specific DNA recombinase